MKRLALQVLCAISFYAAAFESQAIMISIIPTDQTTTTGSSLETSLVVSGLAAGTAPSLGTFDVDVLFNANVLAFSGATFGDPSLGDQLDLFALGAITSIGQTGGTVNLFELSLDLPDDLDNLQAESFALATLTFSAITAGTSTLDIVVNALGDSLGDSLPASIAGGSIMVSTVPEPSTVLLVMLGGALALLPARPSQERPAPKASQLILRLRRSKSNI